MPDPISPDPAAAHSPSVKPSLAQLLAAMPNVGLDSDFERIDADQDAPPIFD